ncbi:MAG: hypothetical protein CMJ83_14075 [Planctomycetes bacterium]|nr:hypothetical protein [Planctomycetota bacterium]
MLLVAELQWETGKRGAAIDTLRAGVRRAHGDLELRAMLGGRLVEAGRMGEAFDELARAISEPGRLPDKLHMAARLVVEARTRAGAVPPGLQRALSDLLTRDVSSVYAAGLAQRLAKDLQAIARALESQGSKTSVLARRRLRQVATDAAIRVETALALLDDAIDRRDVVAALEELSRLLPFEHRGADPVRLRRIWSEAGGWLFGVQPAADALIAPASMREDGSNLVTLDLEHPPSRRLVELANQMGRLDALRARCAAGARDPAWRVFIGAGLRALCGVARKPAATGAIRELARILDGVNNEAPESERAFAVACSLVVSRGCADRPSLRGLVDIVASPQRWRLVAKNQQSGNRRAVIAVRARAAARAGRRESARSLYADLVAGILPGGGRLRGVGLKGGQSARKLYEVVRPYLGRMAEDGFWDLVADALFDLASSDLATAEGSAGGFSEEWDRILGAWEVRAAADPGAGRALSDAIRQARQQRSSDRNVKTIVLLASAKRQERALRDVSRRVLRGGAGLRNLTTGRALWRAGLNEAARRVVIERAPRSTSKAFPRKWSVPWAPDTWASWFTSPEAVRQIVRATASRKNSSLVSWAADLVAVVGTRAERWAPTSRTAYYAAAWPGLRRMGENSHLVNRADNLVARGKLMEAYLLLSRAILQKTEIRMSLVFGGVRAQPGSQRSPARAFLDIAHRVDAVGALRARLRGSAGQAPPRGRVERRLLALLALQDGDIDAATSWIDLVVADWKNAVRFSQDQSRAVLADAANAAPLTRGLALRLLDGYQAPFAPLPIEPIQLARTALAATTPEQALHIISKLLRAKRTGAAVRVLAEAGRGEAIDLYRQLAILEVPPPRAPLLNPRRPGVTLPRPVKTKATPPVPGLWREENLVQTAAARVILGLSPKRLERVVVRIESAASDWERVRGAETVTWIACRIALGRPPSRRQAMERVGSSWPGNAGLLVDMAERSSYATATARIVMDFVERWPAAFRGYGARLVELARRTGVALPLGSKPFLSSLGYQVVDDHDASRWMSRRRTGRLSPLSQDEAAEESAALLTEIVEAARESGDDATAGRAAGLLGRRFGLHQWTHLAIAFTAASDPHAAWAALRDTMGVGDDTPAPRPLAVREWQDHAVAYLDVARRAGALLEASTLPSTTPAAAWCRLLARGHTDRVAFVRDLDRLVAGRLAHRLGDDTGVVSGLLAAAEVAAEVTELKPKATELVSLLAGIPALRRDQARLLDVACKVGAWSDVADLMLRRLGGLDERHAGDAASRFAITRTVQAIVRRAAELGVLDDLASGLERARLDGPFVAGEFARARARLEKKPILPGLAFVAERTGEGMLACTWQMHGAVERQAAGRTLYPPGSAGWTIRVPFVAKAEATVPDADHILVVERVVRGGRWQEFARVNARSPGTTDGLHRATIDADPGSGLRVRARWMDGEQLLARSRSVLVAAAGSDHARDRRGRIVYPGDPRRRLLLNAWAPPGCAGSVRLRNTGFWGSERGRLELPVESPTGSVFVQAVLDSRTGLATENVGQPFPVCASEAISYLTTRDQGRAQWCELQGDPSVAISVRAW